jgi:hypothetical protein
MTPDTLQLTQTQMEKFDSFLKIAEEFIIGGPVLILKATQDLESVYAPLKALWIWKNNKPYPKFARGRIQLIPEDEQEAAKFALNILKVEMSNFPTTIQQDEALLKQPLDQMKLNIVKIRLYEKKILQKHIDNLEQKVLLSK